MASPVFERLQRILDLEEKQEWRNRSVVGGIEALRERWAEDAAQQQIAPELIRAVMDLLRAYVDAEESARPLVAQEVRKAITQPSIQKASEAIAALGLDKQIPTSTPTPKNPAQSPAARSAPKQRKEEGYAPPEPTHVARQQTARRRSQEDQGPDKGRDNKRLEDAVLLVPNVGVETAKRLAKLGIEQVQDLFWHVPSRYEDYSQLRTIAELKTGEQVTLVANLWDMKERKIGLNRSMVEGILGDGSGTLRATWWSKWVMKRLKPGQTLRLSGKVGLYMGQKTLENPEFEPVDRNAVGAGRIMPIYPLTEGLNNRKLISLIRHVLDYWLDQIRDPLPDELRTRYSLLPLGRALDQIHRPESMDAVAAARRRLAFDELFYIQLGVQQRRQELAQSTAPALTGGAEVLEAFAQALPFQMTGAQSRVLDEVAQDLARSVPMSRLIQGDVGSGKTAVAAGAMNLAARNGVQSALLAPTQILAEQHYRGISELLGSLQNSQGQPIRVALLTGRVTGAAREELLSGLKTGEIDVVVGTTALLQEGVAFHSLGFVVVDEQHRFGVEQRGALRSGREEEEAPHPHMLVMSATPIPRSLALTIYGDLDVSIIDEMPPGRTPIKTRWFNPGERERLYGFLRREAAAGRQAYIVYPLVEESEAVNAGSAVEAHQRLSEEIFPDLKVGLLHGQLAGREKDEIMSAFAAGDYDVLVATTVIEVGIDVPNATLMLIEDADRFGLAQLHQLRGRVGRGGHAGYCGLISDGKSAHAEERLRALVETTDGFVLAEKDLVLRGPGDFLGTRQSGLPDLKVAQLSDAALLVTAREAAQALFGQAGGIEPYPELAKQVQRFWQGHGDVN